MPATIMSSSETGEYNGRYAHSISLVFSKIKPYFSKKWKIRFYQDTAKLISQ